MRYLLIFLILLVSSGCGKQEKVDDLIRRAITFAQDGEVRQGILELERAVALDRKCGKAYF